MLGHAMRQLGNQNVEWYYPERYEVNLKIAQWPSSLAARGYALSDFDVIVNAAANVGGIAYNVRKQGQMLADNSVIALHGFLGTQDFKGRYIYIASSCAYPRDASPYKEDMLGKGELEPTNEGYGLAKLLGVKLIQHSGTRNCVALVPCNLYGPYDKFNPHKAHLIGALFGKFWDAQKKGEKEVEIWGDGTQRREFMHVNDLAQAINTFATQETLNNKVYNVGYGIDHSVSEYVEYVRDALKLPHIKPVYNNESNLVGMKQKLMDSRRATLATGWRPQISITVGLQGTAEWYIEFMRKNKVA